MTGGGILPRGVVQTGDGQLFHGLASAAHERLNIHAGHGNGQQAHGGEDGEPAAHVVGHHELLIALGVGQTLQRAPRLVGGGIDALPGPLFAVLLLQQALENAEGDRGLGGGARLGDDVHREVPVADELQQLQQGVGGQAVAGKEHIGGILFLQVIVVGLDDLDDRAGSQIGAADADDHQHLGLLLDLLGRRLDAGELLLVVVPGQVHPAGEITAGAGVGGEHLSRLGQPVLPRGRIILGKKAAEL